MYNAAFYFLLFFSFSVIGWIVECVSCTFWYHKFVHDRGFLLGPYCPVYGFGALYMYIFLSRYKSDALALFIMAVVGTSIIEYITSVLMEKVFKARWWDYTKEPFNLNGRICLKNSILFGILGLGFIYYVKPLYENIVDKIGNNTLIIISIILFTIFLIDCIISFIIMSKLKNKIFDIRHDSTSEIDAEVKEILNDYRFYIKRLFKSFPGISFNLPSGEEIVSSITKTLNNFDTNKKKSKNIKNLK